MEGALPPIGVLVQWDGWGKIAHNVSVTCMHSHQSQFTLREVSQTTTVEHDLVWGWLLGGKARKDYLCGCI